MAELPAVLLVGAGRMGGALYQGWVRAGLAASVLVDPAADPAVARPQDALVCSLAALPAGFAPAVAVVAVKPQQAGAVLPALHAALPPACVVLSIIAGCTLASLADALPDRPVVRAMPNTPAAIGAGVSVACAQPGVADVQRALCTRLLEAGGAVAWIEDEALMDAVTAVSGSGPAYVFLLAELLEATGVAQGLPAPLAALLARRTVAGAGALLAASTEKAAALRRAVTSPGGTTAAALAVLMAEWPGSLDRAVAAAVERGQALLF